MRSHDRRSQILATAERVFAAEGFDRTSIAAVCTAAGIARGTLYQYFENKRALFRALVEHRVERITAFMRPAPGAPPASLPTDRAGLLAMLEARLERIFDAVARDRAFYLILLREASARHAGTADLALEVYQQLRSLIVRELAEAARLGLLACDDPEHLATFVIGGVVAAAASHILDTERASDPRSLAHGTAEAIVRILAGEAIGGIEKDQVSGGSTASPTGAGPARPPRKEG